MTFDSKILVGRNYFLYEIVWLENTPERFFIRNYYNFIGIILRNQLLLVNIVRENYFGYKNVKNYSAFIRVTLFELNMVSSELSEILIIQVNPVQ